MSLRHDEHRVLNAPWTKVSPFFTFLQLGQTWHAYCTLNCCLCSFPINFDGNSCSHISGFHQVRTFKHMSSRSIIVLCVFWVYIKVHILLVNQFYLWSTYTLITSLDLEFYQTKLGCWNHNFCSYCCVFCIVCTQVWCKGLISVVSICEFWTRIVWYCGCGITVHHHLHICTATSQLWWLSPYVSAWLSSATWKAWRLCWFRTPLLWVFGLVPFITSAKLIINHLL